MSTTGMPSSRARPVMIERPKLRPISKNEPLSTTDSTIGRIL